MIIYSLPLSDILSRKAVWPRGQAVKTSPFHGGNTGSIPVGVIEMKKQDMPMWLNSIRLTTSIAAEPDYKSAALRKTEYADVAQLAEQLICNQQVIGSSPIIGFVPLRNRDVYLDL